MRAYSFHGIVGREATVRAAAATQESALVEKLRFGLAFVALSDELITRLAPGGDSVGPPFIEFVRLNKSVVEWAQEASSRGPVGYIEGEFADGAGFHAAVAWRDGKMVYGPQHREEREPVNAVLRLLGVVPEAGMDEMDTVGLADR